MVVHADDCGCQCFEPRHLKELRDAPPAAPIFFDRKAGHASNCPGCARDAALANSAFIKLTSKVDGTGVYIRREAVTGVMLIFSGPEGERETAVYFTDSPAFHAVVRESPEEVMAKLQ